MKRNFVFCGTLVVASTCDLANICHLKLGYRWGNKSFFSVEWNYIPMHWFRRDFTIFDIYAWMGNYMMTSSNGNIFRVTGPLCGEFTGPSEFPTQRPVTRSFNIFFDLRLNKRLSEQPWGWWFETPSWSLWRQCNNITKFMRMQLILHVLNLGRMSNTYR